MTGGSRQIFKFDVRNDAVIDHPFKRRVGDVTVSPVKLVDREGLGG